MTSLPDKLTEPRRPAGLPASLPEGLPDYTGVFEAHVTVTEDAGFVSACAALGVKPVLIELPGGAARVPQQPMTATYHRGTLQEVHGQVLRLCAALREAGYDVSRVKLEAMLRNAGVPQDDTAAQALPAGNYFEHHVKVVTLPGASLEEVQGLCARHGAHLSRNARRQRPDGRQERFVTARHYGVGRREAEVRFGALLEALRTGGVPTEHLLREYTVYDSDWTVDQGWAS